MTLGFWKYLRKFAYPSQKVAIAVGEIRVPQYICQEYIRVHYISLHPLTLRHRAGWCIRALLGLQHLIQTVHMVDESFGGRGAAVLRGRPREIA